MTEPLPPEAPPDGGLQFDKAEYAAEAPAALTCATCARQVSGTYYEINGKVLCEPCRDVVAGQLAGGMSPARFAKACLFGGAAAVAGFAIYFAVAKITGLEVGLISVLVGFMVGAAVRAGANHRGGLAYQVLAVFLTYTAIAASYSMLLMLFLSSPEVKKFVQEQKANAAKPAPPGGKAAVVEAPGSPPGDQALAAGPPVNPLVATVSLLTFVYTWPIQSNLESPMGLLIIGFAVWEAWKLNKRPRLVFNGPYRAGGQGEPLASGPPSHA